MDKKNRCKTCKHFQRSNWIDSLCDGDQVKEQLSGKCVPVKSVLSISNPTLFRAVDYLVVDESFSCVFHLPND